MVRSAPSVEEHTRHPCRAAMCPWFMVVGCHFHVYPRGGLETYYFG